MLLKGAVVSKLKAEFLITKNCLNALVAASLVLLF